MRLVTNRLRTFSNWYFTRATLQLHGFFSLGVRDRVKLLLQGQYDEPWEEHAKWYPTVVLLQQKGKEYVHFVFACFANINRPMRKCTVGDTTD